MRGDIKCKACKPKDTSCSVCGGYKFVYVQEKCPTCGEKYFTRPGAYTIYEGKKFRTLDGLTITYSLDGKSTCSRCESV